MNPRIAIERANQLLKLISILREKTESITSDILAEDMRLSISGVRKYLNSLAAEAIVIKSTILIANRDRNAYCLNPSSSLVNAFIDRTKLYIETAEQLRLNPAGVKTIKAKPKSEPIAVIVPSWRDDPLLSGIMGPNGPSAEQESFE